MKTCPRCGSAYDDSNSFCSRCGSPLNFAHPTTPPPYGRQQYPRDNPFDASGPQGKCRGIAALFAILLGFLGIHYFYINKTSGGIICILLCLITCGLWQIVTLVQGIMILFMTNGQFQLKYVESDSNFPLF